VRTASMNSRHLPWIFTAILFVLGLWLLAQTCSRPRGHTRTTVPHASPFRAAGGLGYSTSSGEICRLSPAPTHLM
jgi:hypothetical protein